MSYDLHAYRIADIADLPPKELRRRLSSGGVDFEPLSRDEMERLAQALMEVDPAAERYDESDFIEIDSSGIQVSIAEDEAGISVPYHFTGADADTVMARAFEYAEVMTTRGGLTVWDPQTEEIVGAPQADRCAAARRFSATTAALDEMVAAERAAGAEPPRWMFWKRR